MISTLSHLIAELSLCTMWHMIALCAAGDSTLCAAGDLPRPLEPTCICPGHWSLHIFAQATGAYMYLPRPLQPTCICPGHCSLHVFAQATAAYMYLPRPLQPTCICPGHCSLHVFAQATGAYMYLPRPLQPTCICPGHWSLHARDSLLPSEEIVTNLQLHLSMQSFIPLFIYFLSSTMYVATLITCHFLTSTMCIATLI